MPLSAIKTVAQAQNGVGAFIFPCKRMVFQYCDWAGSSRGMNAFIKNSLPAFAKRNPQIEICVYPRHGHHPAVTASYINGNQRSICVKNLQNEGVREKVELLRNSRGVKNKRIANKPVTSINESVRGVWSPFHGAKIKI